MLTRILFFLFLLTFVNLPAQFSASIYGTRLPVSPDTTFYPYYNGVQMIEIDYMPVWENECWRIQEAYATMSQQPFMPPPPVNIYLFRNPTGEIVKAFNTDDSLEKLTAGFRAVSPDRKSPHIRSVNSHRWPRRQYSMERYDQELESNTSDADFKGLYRIYTHTWREFSDTYGFTTFMPAKPRYIGLIDSLGNVFLEMKYSAIVPLADHILLVQDTVCGVINRKKEEVVPFEYDKCDVLNAGEVVFMKDQKIRLIYSVRPVALKYIDDYDFIAFSNCARLRGQPEQPETWLVQFRKNGKTGLLDTSYNVVIPAMYDMIAPQYRQDRAVCCRNGKFGYLDTTGKEAIPCTFMYAESFRNGAAVVQYEGKFRSVDKDGKILDSVAAVHERWRNPSHSNEGYTMGALSVVQTTSGCGLIRARGEIFVVPPIYEGIQLMRVIRNGVNVVSDDMFIAKLNGKTGILDTSGNVIVPMEYESIDPHTDVYGFRIVSKDPARQGMLNSRFELVIPCVYQSIYRRYEEEKNFRVGLNNKYGMMDTSGTFIIPPEYAQINLFRDGRALARKDSLYGFIDERGNTLVPFEFEQLYGDFSNGLAGFLRDGKWGYIDTKGKVVIEPEYDAVGGFKSSIAGVKLNGKWGFINRKGKLVVDYIYDSVGSDWCEDGTLEVTRNGKVGFINEKGREVIPCEYTKNWGYSPGFGHFLEKDGMKNYVKK